MFTLGREREKEHSHQYLKSQEEARRIEALIDVVHDLLDGTKFVEAAVPVFVEAFAHGGSGVWEQAGTWLRKLSESYRALAELWPEFCKHRSSKVRFRAAAFLDYMPADVFSKCFPDLRAEASVNVWSEAAAGCYRSKDPSVREILNARLAIETDDTVKKAITFALNYGKS